MMLAFLFSCALSQAIATNIRSKSTMHRRFFPIAELANDLHLLSIPRDSKLLRGSTLDFPMSSGPMALPVTGMVLQPMDAEFDTPEEEAMEERISALESGPVLESVPASAEGPLRDLVDFGSAMGEAVLPRADERGSPLELPMDILHVKMQQQVPKPLSVDDFPGKVRIYGNLPTGLTAKTLQVSSEGRNLLVKYFIDDGKQAGNSIVGIDERFTLDFEPQETPAVRYKPSTGSFELTLPRPQKKELSGKQVSIDFDDVQPEVAPQKAVVQETPPAAVPVIEKVDAKSNPESTRTSVEDIADEFAKHFQRYATPTKQSIADKSADSSRQYSVPVEKPIPKAYFSAKATSKAEVLDTKALAKMTKQLREDGKAQKSVNGKNGQAARAKEIADKAKRFVAEARLGDAKMELQNAFAPQIFEGEGLVLLELNH